MNHREIRPCSCGNQHPTLIHRAGRFYVHCTVCSFSGTATTTEGNAVLAWNDQMKKEKR